MKPRHVPDMATLLRETDPQRRKQELEKALQNLDRATPPDYLESFQADEAADAVEARGRAPSKGEAGAGAAEERPVTKAADPPIRRWQRTWKLVAGAALVAAAMPVLVVLAGRSTGPRERAAAASAGAAATATAGPSGTGAVMGIAPPVVTVVTATASATAVAGGTVAPSSTTSSPVPAAAKPRGKASATREDAGAPLPLAMAAEPAATATPSAKPPTEDNPVF